MVKRLLLLGLVAFALGAQAQFQLTNPGFDGEWSTIQPYTGGNSTDVGTTPSGWCVANVAGYYLDLIFYQMWTGKTEVASRVDGHTDYACKLENKDVMNNVIPGYVTLGTSWNTANTTGGNADGGSFGGASFTGTPDAIEFYYKRTASDNSQPASVVAYMWKGSTTQANVPVSIDDSNPTKVKMTNRDRNILGMSYSLPTDEPTSSSDFSLIASLMTDDEHIVRLTEVKSEWTKATYEFTYHNATDKPTMINVVFGAMDYFTDRSKHIKGNTLTVDDVKFLYYSELASCSYNGTAVTFTNGAATIDEFYDASKLSVASNGHGATIEKSMNEATQLLTITVKGEDISENSSNYHTYTIQFKDAASPEVVSTKIYTEPLYITIDGSTSDKQYADVTVQTLDNGNINFVLNNFVLGGRMPVGNIAVEGIEVASDKTFSYKGDIQIAPGDDSYPMWFGPTLPAVPLDLKGEFLDESHIIVTIEIDMRSTLEQMIYVHLGYARATMAVNATAKYGTFCAPFAVEIPTGVTASKVTGVGANGLLTLTDLSTTIPANTPVVLFAESGLETVELFGVAEEGNPVGLLTGVYEPTDITSGYVLQNLDGMVAFYLVDSEITVPANRCYLTLDNNAPGVKALAFPDGTMTSISEIQAADEKAVIYDLSGRRVSKATKGIYITNGKKFLVK